MIRLLLLWLLNALALMCVAYVIPGVQVHGFASALWAAFILGLVNTLVRPVLLLLTLPLTILTLGLFYFVLNGLMFYWVGNLLDGFHVSGVLAAIFAALLYSVVATFLAGVFLRPQVKIERIQ